MGYTVAADGSAEVSFAVIGDTDPSRAVNVFDLVNFNRLGAYGSGAVSDRSKGDFYYDGVTNVLELVGVNTAGANGQRNYFPTAPSAGSVAAVPEPRRRCRPRGTSLPSAGGRAAAHLVRSQ